MRSSSKVRQFVLLLALFNVIVQTAQYTQKEQIALKKFRKKVGPILYRDYMKEDLFLIRWLRANDLNVADATEMLTEANQWRIKNKIDTILNETILHFPAPPFYVDGFSYSGRPVLTIDLGRIDMRSLLAQGKRNQLIRFAYQIMEISEVGLRHIRLAFTRYEITDGIIIVDLSGFTLRQHACVACLSVHIEWMENIEKYVPGLIKEFILINTPRSYARIIDLLQNTLADQTIEGLRIYGTNKKKWTKTILRTIPPTQLRRQFGGTKPEEVHCPPTNFTCQFLVFWQIESVQKDFPLIDTTNNTYLQVLNKYKHIN